MHSIFRALGWLMVSAGLAVAATGYYRYPTIHGESIVFTSEGDLWRVGLNGGAAQRLTSHLGMESHAAFSADGQWLAFSAEYEGPTEVYVMPVNGGLPRRLTYEGETAWVAGWTTDGRVLYRTSSYSTLPNAQLAVVNPANGAHEILPLAEASGGVYGADQKTLFFTRLPKQGSSTKRYRGGWIENLWRYGPGTDEAMPLAGDFDGTSRNPMWWQGRIYFVSDRDGTMNLWSMLPDGTDWQQITRHTEFDLKTASLEAGRIVYARRGQLHVYDLARGVDRALEITLISDLDQQREKWVKRPFDYLTSAHLSPKGDRLVLTARGQVFVAPLEAGRFVEVPRPPDVRYRNAGFLPDGQSLMALSDATGELEFVRLPANGVGAARPMTTNGKVFRFPAQPSPDGRWLAWGDKDQKFWLHDLTNQLTTLVAENSMDPIVDFAWSPDGRWLAYVATADNTYPQIHLYEVEGGTRAVVTSDRVESRSPAWSVDGKWLYFLSDRELRSLVGSPWGSRQPEPHFAETAKIYALALQKDLRFPFAIRDELQASGSIEVAKPTVSDKQAANVDGGKSSSEAIADKSSVTNRATGAALELSGLAGRLYEVPVPAGNYSQLALTEKHLLWLARDTGFGAKTHLKQLEITAKDPKPKTLVEDIGSYEMSGDLKKLLVRKGDTFHVIASDATAPAKLEDTFGLTNWSFSITPREEWRQILRESWRMLRDYFYDRHLHGLDWNSVLTKYLPLADRVSDRSELSEVISEMAGELSALHIYVRFGDVRESPDQIRPASLGARLEREGNGGLWRVAHVFKTDSEYPERVSPLARPEVAVREGDHILQINGRDLTDVDHPEMLLRNQAGKQVLMEVRPAGTATNRSMVVRPLTVEDAAGLRYTEWEYTRRLEVDRMSNRQIGYVHLRAMGSDNIAEWAREFYPVFNRSGLIIDVRHNRGGNIDSWILGRLLRKAWFYWQPRVGQPTWNMQYAFRGHVVVLCNQRTASDGEAFAEGFRRLGLGKVIGTRTWGGEIWLSASRWLVDSGMATAAETGVYGPEGSWLIEGHGVDPDLVVDNLPHETFEGRDAQLEAAVKHLQDLMAQDPRPVPPAPRHPDLRFPK